MARHALMSSLKNEGPFILEWVAHHVVLGFDAIYVASNDCTDGSDGLLDALQAEGILHHVRNVLTPGDIPQHAGYARIRALHPVDQVDWVMVLDADEFLNVHIGDHRVQDLTALAGPATDIIRLSARTFSDLPQTEWQPGPVTRAFPMALRPHHPSNTAIKCLTRDSARFRQFHNHHPHGFLPGGPLDIYCAQTGTHLTLPPKRPFANHLRYINKDAIGHEIAQYNHYAVKTLDSYMLRRQRGRGAVAATDAENDRHTFDYFNNRAGKGKPELSILRYAVETDRLMQDWLAVPAIAAAHHACEAAHAAAIAAMLSEIEF